MQIKRISQRSKRRGFSDTTRTSRMPPKTVRYRSTCASIGSASNNGSDRDKLQLFVHSYESNADWHKERLPRTVRVLQPAFPHFNLLGNCTFHHAMGRNLRSTTGVIQRTRLGQWRDHVLAAVLARIHVSREFLNDLAGGTLYWGTGVYGSCRFRIDARTLNVQK